MNIDDNNTQDTNSRPAKTINNRDVFHQEVLGMAFEAAIIITLVVVFLFSCCGLLKKIRQSYEQSEVVRQRALHNEVFTIVVPNSRTRDVFQTSAAADEPTSGIFPTAPPPYTEYTEPPPRYDDVIKIPTITDNCSPIVTSRNPVPVHESPPAYST